ncbi:AAA family ATPase [Azospirillum sp.]|uniref:AAA family ATPase n=1 Tax=Azospirillum sp. TaxID=34012 RepID=UPI003D72FA7C
MTALPIHTPTRADEPPPFASIDAIEADFGARGYICGPGVATTVYLAAKLAKPILVEGPPGVGKTELAKVAARHAGLTLHRLQCYEGVDEAKALYEWKYGKQLLYTQMLKEKLSEVLDGAADLAEGMRRLNGFSDAFFSEAFLEERPLLKALRSRDGAVLLVDEIDKADQEFEALLLEMLSDYQVTVPEIGTLSASVKPLVILTSNSTRTIGEALRRRCLYLHIDFPAPDLERRILHARVPGIDDALAARLVTFIDALRTLDLRKGPSVSELIEWAQALVMMNVGTLDEDTVRRTLGLVVKFRQDMAAVEDALPALLSRTP